MKLLESQSLLLKSKGPRMSNAACLEMAMTAMYSQAQADHQRDEICTDSSTIAVTLLKSLR